MGDYQLEKSKGRLEIRWTTAFQICPLKEWETIKSAIKVERLVISKARTTKETAYFVSSLSVDNSEQFFAEGIRKHWHIENSLHYVKDVTFKEDKAKITKGHSPDNISLFTNIAINIFRNNQFTNIAQAIRLVSNDIPTLIKLILA